MSQAPHALGNPVVTEKGSELGGEGFCPPYIWAYGSCLLCPEGPDAEPSALSLAQPSKHTHTAHGINDARLQKERETICSPLLHAYEKKLHIFWERRKGPSPTRQEKTATYKDVNGEKGRGKMFRSPQFAKRARKRSQPRTCRSQGRFHMKSHIIQLMSVVNQIVS
mmetsp:Transcript_38478/g.115401  ORF Transcript_38478/g.115401 Transcript_38478/m.115401 type:complete len:166 (+) Transcript_38478:1790-2287(+)